jgi:hypothetical protein
MTPPIGVLATEHAQRRAADMMAACAAGACRYADPHRTRAQCEAVRLAGCDGYEAHVYLQDGGAVLRWRRCPRFTAWWRVEKGRLEKRRAAEARAKRGRDTPREWSEEA